MATETTLMTAEEYAKLHPDSDSELVRGVVIETVRPGGRHGEVCSNVVIEVGVWARANQAGTVVCNDSGVITERNPDTVRGLDAYFISTDRIPDEGLPEGWLEIPPDLCVEVLSPNDRWNDVLAKTSEYLTMGVREVWIVDPEEAGVHIYVADAPPRDVRSGATLSSPILPGFASDPKAFFEA
ncbi:MAG: Uma2 family endonuclease [Planctomycetota bacterium]|nr:MAG: Uma2 family endonuclease [Planctomycetota bacterium]REJ94823.1 MAG: Uma2 family endonuclease [Planctomycetota bacterium]REK36827.1 MAG: Uma2 family endonuclease [Planctomycetota bacterium]